MAKLLENIQQFIAGRTVLETLKDKKFRDSSNIMYTWAFKSYNKMAQPK